MTTLSAVFFTSLLIAAGLLAAAAVLVGCLALAGINRLIAELDLEAKPLPAAAPNLSEPIVSPGYQAGGAAAGALKGAGDAQKLGGASNDPDFGKRPCAPCEALRRAARGSLAALGFGGSCHKKRPSEA